MRAAAGCWSVAIGSASSRSTVHATASGSCSPARPRRCSRCPASARARSGRVALLSGAGLCAGAAIDLPRHPQAAAGDAAGRRRRPRRGAALLARARATSIARVSEEEWIARVRARLEESVRMQMVSDVPIGAFLSGGIDSSAVVAFMSAHSDRPVKTYSIGFAGGEAEAFYNELPYARQVASAFDTDHHEILVRPDVVVAAAAAALAHGRADRRHRLHHDLSGVGVRAPRRHRHPFRRRRRRAVRRLPPLSRRSLPGVFRSPAAGAAARGARAWREAAERPPFAAAQRDAAGQGLSLDGGLAVRGALSLLRQVFSADVAAQLLRAASATDAGCARPTPSTPRRAPTT